MFFLKKAAWLIFSLWAVVSLTFFLMHLVPGDPFLGDHPLPPETHQALLRYYGLDQPLWIQYAKYLERLLHGDLGVSLIYPSQSVAQILKEGFPVSFRLGVQALSLAIPLGILLGGMAAWKKGKWQDGGALLFSTLGVSIPNFVLAAFLQWLFALKLDWLPIARWGPGISHTLLPTLALAVLPAACIARLFRASLLEVFAQDYIRTAYAKGLSPFRVLLSHGLKNGLLPLLGYFSPMAAQILTGSFVVEKIFALPGLGQWMTASIHARDYPLIAGLALFFSAWLMLFVFAVDQLHTLLDPRLRLSKRTAYA